MYKSCSLADRKPKAGFMNYLVGEITVLDPIEPRGILILAGSYVKTNPKPQKTTAQECTHAIKSPVTVLGAFGGMSLIYGRGECLSSAGEIGPRMSTAAVSPAPCVRPTPITSTFGIASGSPSFSFQFFPSLVPSKRWRVRNASRACLSRPRAQEHEAKLRVWMSAKGLQADESGSKGSETAGYDPTLTPGPLGRNEVPIRISSS